MQAADAGKFRAVITAMLRMFGQAPDPVILDGYWMALSDWPLEDFEKAAKHLMGSSDFMPRPAAFNALRKASAMTAGEAFEKARQIVRSKWQSELISYQSGDVRLDTAIRACGGFEALAMCTTENVGYFERRFAEHYESISDADETRLALLSIAPRLNGPMRLSEIKLPPPDKGG